VYLAEDGDQILGYCVCRINRYKPKYHVGYIVDLLTLPDRNDVAETLVRHTVNFLDDSGVNIIRSLNVKHNQIDKCLKKFGFVDSRIKQYVGISPREMNRAEIRSLSQNILMKKVHFVYGDFDTI
jgi:hypothetical protein